MLKQRIYNIYINIKEVQIKMFNRKAKKIKELQKTVELLTATIKEANNVIEERDASISKLRQNIIQLTGEKALVEEALAKVETENKLLTNRLQTNKLINRSLQKANSELKTKDEHIKELNRNRQRKFREAHKNDKKK